jgi:hypothetical protein
LVEVRRFKMARLGGFADDIAREAQVAARAGRPADREKLRSLWLDFLEARLPAMGDEPLLSFLQSRRLWRQEGDWPVLRSAGEPCVAFTFSALADGTVDLIALAACDRFPKGSEEEWWQKVVRPRVVQL